MTDTSGDAVPLAGLDFEQLGRTVAMLVPVSVHLRHASLISTLRDYIHPEPLSEADFVRDLFTEPLGEVIAKWYGSRDNAAALAAAVVDQVLDGLIAGDGGALSHPVRLRIRAGKHTSALRSGYVSAMSQPDQRTR